MRFSIKKLFKRFFSSAFFLIFVIKTLDPESEPDPDSLEILDPDPYPQQRWFPESDVPLPVFRIHDILVLIRIR
jgi:hypothetical protein